MKSVNTTGTPTKAQKPSATRVDESLTTMPNDLATRRAVLWRVRLSDVLGPERQHTRLSVDESFAGIAFDVLSLRT